MTVVPVRVRIVIGWSMTVADGRPRPPHAGDERAVLAGFLDFQRATVLGKVRGLSEEQARQSLLPSR
jgi:hypothetical protein